MSKARLNYFVNSFNLHEAGGAIILMLVHLLLADLSPRATK